MIVLHIIFLNELNVMITPARVNKPPVVNVKIRQQYGRNWRITEERWKLKRKRITDKRWKRKRITDKGWKRKRIKDE